MGALSLYSVGAKLVARLFGMWNYHYGSWHIFGGGRVKTISDWSIWISEKVHYH